ncbi:hypothetical protein [Anaerotardibacter muris]|uniref:hypothetical protein n=1 Tax=Anaerotardibacter muris TaxID=2941505 RepID=UPI00203DBF91|nr:hypothetical protein [Anaerotardibacter muris]
MNNKDRKERLARLAEAEKRIKENSKFMKPISGEENLADVIKKAKKKKINICLASESKEDRLKKLEIAHKNIAKRSKKMKKCSIPVGDLIEQAKEERLKEFLALEED